MYFFYTSRRLEVIGLSFCFQKAESKKKAAGKGCPEINAPVAFLLARAKASPRHFDRRRSRQNTRPPSGTSTSGPSPIVRVETRLPGPACAGG